MDPLVHRLAEAGNVLPAEALREAAAQWEDRAAASLLALLEAYVERRDRSDAAAGALFFALFLFGQMRETRAFPALCRLAREPEALETVLGDGVTENLAGILAATHDGPPDALQALMESEEADESARNAAMDALVLLVFDGRLDRVMAEGVLREVHDRMAARTRTPDWVWVGWLRAVGLLGLEALRPQGQALFRRGRIHRSFMERRDFEKDMREGMAARADPAARPALMARHHLAPAGDAVEVLSRWHGFTEAGRREAEEAERRRDLSRLDAAMAGKAFPAEAFDIPAPATNRVRDVGRNDPCPCGSGKKFKKCCLAA